VASTAGRSATGFGAGKLLTVEGVEGEEEVEVEVRLCSRVSLEKKE